MTHHTFHLHFWQVEDNKMSFGKWTIDFSICEMKKKSFKNLGYISVSVRDSSNSLATIIAGHLLKMATGGKKKDAYFNDNYSDIFANCLLKVWLDKNETFLMGFHDVWKRWKWWTLCFDFWNTTCCLRVQSRVDN